jgi:hypothetical protein
MCAAVACNLISNENGIVWRRASFGRRICYRDFRRIEKWSVCVCGVSKNRDTQHAYVFSQREEAKNVCVCRVNPLLLFDIDSLTPSLSFSWFFIFISAPFHPSLHSLCLSVFRVYIACKRRENVRLQTRSETGTL